MRTTVTLDDDIAAAVGRIQRERGLGMSAALNELARAGLTARVERSSFRQRTVKLGLNVDMTNVAEALELLEGPGAR